NRADVSLDLAVDPLPFGESTVDLIFTYHTLEHIKDYLFALGEIYRVLRPGGLLLVGVPYATSTEYHLVNPYHVNNFNEHSFAFFDESRLRGSAAEVGTPKFQEVFCRMHYIGAFKLLP